MRPSTLSLVLVTLAFLSGCGIFEPDWQRRVGLLLPERWVDFFGEQFVVPENALVGTPFEVTVTTLGGGCRRAGRTDVRVDHSEAVITPYDLDRVLGKDEVCLADANGLDHSVDLAFDEPGEATVVLRVRLQQGGPVVELTETVLVGVVQD